jgi:rSAM/selenodomain-associated transferase 1
MSEGVRKAGRCLVVFAKRPAPGRVKTRLCPAVTPAAAARLYEAFLHDVLRTAREVRAARRLAISPWNEADWFRARWPDFELVDQGPGGLGDRLVRVADGCFAGGASAVVISGSDSPTLPSSLLVAAFEALEEGAEVVFGPSQDGGYYLVGLSRPEPRLFRGVPFSSPEALAASLAAAGRERLRVELLPSWYDVDEPADVERLRAELVTPSGARVAPSTARALLADPDGP